MNKIIKVAVLGLQVLADGNCVLITKKDSNNPSKSGVFQLTKGQAERLAQRAIGIPSVATLKAAIALDNGSATYTIEQELCKVGTAWKNERTGETGIYGMEADGVTPKLNKEGKPMTDWLRDVNQEVTLGFAAQSRILDLTLNHALSNTHAAPVSQTQPVVASAAPVNQPTV